MLFISGNPSYPLVSTGMYCLISLKSFLANSSRRRFDAILRIESAPNRRRRHREKARHYCDKGATLLRQRCDTTATKVRNRTSAYLIV